MATIGEEKERISPFEEFESGFGLLANMGSAILSGDEKSAVSDALMAYPYMRAVRENVGKYLFALKNIRGNVVDVPCGLGYGSAILASSGNVVTGIDISREAVAECDRLYRYKNLRFVRGDMTAADTYRNVGQIDSIVCFDGLEHVVDGHGALGVMKDALTPGGVAVVSVPNSQVMELSVEDCRYHMTDYTVESFIMMVSYWFDEYNLFGIDMLGGVSEIGEAYSSYIAVCRK